MTHFNSFVLAIKDSKHNTLREYDKKVYLPFHSEYSLFLKNLHSCRAAVEISIDGTDVLGGNRIIIPANGSTNLERFVNSDRKFMFVPAGDSRVQDPTASENGLVVVKFYKEYIPYTYGYSSTNLNITRCSVKGATTFSSNVGSGPIGFASNNMAVNCCDNGPILADQCSAGATVEGGKSEQVFTDVHGFTTEAYCTTLTLQLLGSPEPVTVKATRTEYCTKCGGKVAFNDNYCGKCGKKQ